MTAVATVDAGVPPPRPRYSDFTRNWLLIDLALCVLLGLFALAGLAGLVMGVVDQDDPAYASALVEVLIQVGIVACGLTGNILLLRQRRSGAALAWAALFLVCVAIGWSMHMLGLRLGDPESTCPEETIIGGYVVGLFFRVVLNAVYTDALRRANRFLRGLPERVPKAGARRAA